MKAAVLTIALAGCAGHVQNCKATPSLLFQPREACEVNRKAKPACLDGIKVEVTCAFA